MRKNGFHVQGTRMNGSCLLASLHFTSISEIDKYFIGKLSGIIVISVEITICAHQSFSFGISNVL